MKLTSGLTSAGNRIGGIGDRGESDPDGGHIRAHLPFQSEDGHGSQNGSESSVVRGSLRETSSFKRRDEPSVVRRIKDPLVR